MEGNRRPTNWLEFWGDRRGTMERGDGQSRLHHLHDAMLEDPSTILYGVADLKAAWEDSAALGKNICRYDRRVGLWLALTRRSDRDGAVTNSCAGARRIHRTYENMIASNGGMIYATDEMPYVADDHGGVAMNETPISSAKMVR
ncbi:MAG: hypothetical protein ACLS6G_09180 [Christensenellales bacterium]